MSDASSPLTVMSSPLSELSEPPGSPEPLQLSPSVLDEVPELDYNAISETVVEDPAHQQLIEPTSPVQPIETDDADVGNDGSIYAYEDAAHGDEDEVVIVEERSNVPGDAIDLSNEPELTQNGNVIEVRWAGGAADEDLIIEVDANGYEVQKSDGKVVDQEQDGMNGDGSEDDLFEDGEKGARSLLDCCRGIVMRLAPRYDDIGDLQYQQHPLFFDTLPAKQLEELEGNSPAIKKDTDHLWKQFVMQKSLADYKSYEEEPPRSWRRVYKHLLREEERKILQAAEDMKASYAAEEMEKRAKRTQFTTATLRDLGYRKKPAASAGSSRGKPTTLLGKVREKTIQERKFRAPPSLTTPQASTLDSLIFPTSGPYSTLGAFHPSSTSKFIGGKGSGKSSLPAPPFVYPSIALRQQIRDASRLESDIALANSISASRAADGAPSSSSRLLKRSLPDDDSDSDDVTFIASSSKGKERKQPVPSSPRSDHRPSTAAEGRKRTQPVDMDFFSIPSTLSSTTSRQHVRKASSQDTSANDTAQQPSNPRPTKQTNHPPSSQALDTQNRLEVEPRGASASWTGAAPCPPGRSRSRVNSTLFVPKRRKVH